MPFYCETHNLSSVPGIGDYVTYYGRFSCKKSGKGRSILGHAEAV